MKPFRPRVLLIAAILPFLSMTHVCANDFEGTKAVAAGKPIVKRVRLQYITPSGFLQGILGGASIVPRDGAPVLPEGTASPLPPGIAHIDTNDVTNTIVFTGTRDAIDQVVTLVQYLDVNRKLVELQVTFMRYSNENDKSDTQATAIASGKAILPNNGSGDICAVGDGHVLRVHLTPHINGDDTCSLFSQVSSQVILAGSNSASVLGPVKQDAQQYVRGKVNLSGTPIGAEALPEIESLQTRRGPSDGNYFAIITPFRVQTY